MARFAIATAAYPTNSQFIEQFVSGIRIAVDGHAAVRLIVAAEAGFNAAAPLGALSSHVILDIRQAPRLTTPASLRRLMIAAAAESDAEMVIFADFDDRLLPHALDLHAAALRDASISYGDMDLIDEAGRSIGRQFFDDAQVPAWVDGEEKLYDRNFIGFTNSAVRNVALKEHMPSIPDTIAAADWWFFTMLLSKGNRAKSTESEVVDYRVRPGSVAGAGVSANVEVLRRRAKIVLEHYAALPPRSALRDRENAVSSLIDVIDEDADSVDDYLSQVAQTPGVWFEDVSRAAAWMQSDKSNAARAIR